MSVRTFAVLLVLGIAVGVGVWLPMHHSGGDSDQSSPATSLSPAPGAADASPAPTAAPSGRPAQSAGSTPGSSPAHGSGTPSSHPGAGTEIVPQPSSAPSTTGALPGLSTPKSTTKPLISTPLPHQAVAKGRLTSGYPAVLAPPKGHTVGTSSVSPGGSALQVGLTATCTRPCDAVKAFRLRLAARGFTEVSSMSVENRPAASFQRDADSVTVTVTSTSKHTIAYTLFGVLHTKA